MTSFSLRIFSVILLSFMFLLTACGGGGSSSGPDLISCSDSAGVGGQTVTVTCTANTTAPLNLLWQVKDAQGNPVSVSANGLTASFVPATAGAFTVSLRATADSGTETASFHVAVANPPPDVSCPATVSAKAKRELVVDCSSSDFSGRTLTYAWELTPPPSNTDTLTTANAEDAVFTPSQTGNYLLVLTVTAPDGQQQTANVTVNVSPAEPWKIVAIGDSITQSNLEHASYRYPLWKKLIDGGYDFDLVGTQHVNSNQTAGTGSVTGPQVGQDDYKGKSFDPDHEGYWGETAGQVLTRLQTSLLTLTNDGKAPDVALIHLGTNDMLATGDSATKVQGAISSIEDIIDLLRVQNPNVAVIVAKVIPYASDSSGQIVLLNDVIDKLDETKGTADSPVVIVDQYTGFNATVGVDSFDGIHPNASGEEKIASKFFGELQKIIK